MKKQVRYFIGWLFISFCVSATSLIAQDTEIQSGDTQQNGTMKVYLDCASCDYNHVRREITFVNYVRDPAKADIHVFVTDEETGAGGTEYEFSYFGRGAFSGTEYTLKHYIDRDATSDEIRDALNRFLKMGFASYMLQTPGGTRFSFDYEEIEEGSAQRTMDDPWDHWVFEIYAGSIELELETNQNEFDSRWGFYADRVTEEWKLRFRPYFNYNKVEIQQEEGEDPVTSGRHRHGLESYAIRSFSDHWSVGAFGTYLTEKERNINHEFNVSPGIEYSLLPYEAATRKAITFTYRIGFAYLDYYEETIFGQKEESLVNQQLQVEMSIQQPWGNIYTGLTGSHYFHDIARRRLEFYGQLSVRITEGLSLSFQADYDVVQDQLSLPSGEASLEEILLQQRELATDYLLSGSIGISYTFGSDFASIVNTRF